MFELSGKTCKSPLGNHVVQPLCSVPSFMCCEGLICPTGPNMKRFTLFMTKISSVVLFKHVRYRVPEFPHSSATFNIILGSPYPGLLPKFLQGPLGDSACPTQCSQPYPVPANRNLTGLTWFPIVLNLYKVGLSLY